MDLRNNFFYIISEAKSENGISDYGIRFNIENPIFQGHFPEHPIVPGTCILRMVVELTELENRKKVSINNIKEIKFIKAITPDKNYHISLKQTSLAEGLLSIKGNITEEKNRICSKFSIIYNI